MSTEPDEFDLIPDEFQDERIDWAQLLSQGTPAVAPMPSSSPEYYATSLDDDVLAELDILDGTAARAQSSSMPSFGPAGLTSNIKSKTASTRKVLFDSKRVNISDSPRKKRRKCSHPSTSLISSLEDEVTCAICCDLLVAAQVLNPCGHTFCGECAWEWVMKRSNVRCPFCRKRLANSPMTPNIALNHVVDLHIRIRASQDDRWCRGGSRLLEFQARQKRWQDSCATRLLRLANMRNRIVVEDGEESGYAPGDDFEDDDDFLIDGL